MAKVKTGIKDLPPRYLIPKVDHVIKSMTDNPHFPNPSPSLATMQTALDNLNKAVIAAVNRDRLKISYRNEQDKVMRTLFTSLAGYVQSKSQGDKLIILSSGFKVVKRGFKKDLLSASFSLKAILLPGMRGLIKLKWKPVRGAKGYMIYKQAGFKDGVAEWEQLTFSTRSSYLVKGLERAKFHSFRVVPVNAAGFGVLSNVVTSVAP